MSEKPTERAAKKSKKEDSEIEEDADTTKFDTMTNMEADEKSKMKTITKTVANKAVSQKKAGNAKLLIQCNELHWQYPQGQMTFKIFNKTDKRFCARISSSVADVYAIKPEMVFVEEGKDVVIAIGRKGVPFKDDERIIVESAEANKKDKDLKKFWSQKELKMNTAFVKMIQKKK